MSVTIAPVATEATFRIGTLSKRVGVSPELLRAWERRYGLLQPARSPGGYRLYSHADEARVRAMRRHLADGLSASDAARLALADHADAGDTVGDLHALADELRGALDRFDEADAQAAFDRVLAAYSLETVLRDVVLPYLHALGERWESGEATVAQEHFASNVLRGRLLGLARGWGSGGGPIAVLACAPGEQHDLPLLAFGLVLARHGWRIRYLGPDTPAQALADAVADGGVRLVVVVSVREELLLAVRRELAALSARVPVSVAGRGATRRSATRTRASLLEGDPVSAARSVDVTFR
jgi:MerR family transcriptional regulator, light-induced transcriptional regulator